MQAHWNEKTCRMRRETGKGEEEEDPQSMGYKARVLPTLGSTRSVLGAYLLCK